MKNAEWLDGKASLIALAMSAFAGSVLPCGAETTMAQSSAAELPAIRLHAPTEPAPMHTPGGIPAWDHPVTVIAPEESLGPQGTLAIWFQPAEELRGAGKDLVLLNSDAIAAVIKRSSASTDAAISFGPAMTGPSPDGRKHPYAERTLLTHLKKDRWYQAAWTWDAKRAEQPVRFFLNGVRQEALAASRYPGQIKGTSRTASFRLGGKGLAVSGLFLCTAPMSDVQLMAWYRASGHDEYSDEGMQRGKQRFEPEDVDWKHPVYATRFEGATVLDDWRLECGLSMSASGGLLVLESDSNSDRSQTNANHLVCWLAREIPADFLLEFGVRPRNRRQGLNIVFFNARGLGGENIFAPTLQTRNGLFQQYHSGDINNYHISYWSGGRGTSNLRKNRGFHLAAIGEDLVEAAPADHFQTIRVYKKAGTIRLTVDGQLALRYDDDGRTFGPVHTHSGWIGLRQMAHTQRCEYDRFAVYPLLSAAAATAPTAK